MLHLAYECKRSVAEKIFFRFFVVFMYFKWCLNWQFQAATSLMVFWIFLFIWGITVHCMVFIILFLTNAKTKVENFYVSWWDDGNSLLRGMPLPPPFWLCLVARKKQVLLCDWNMPLSFDGFCSLWFPWNFSLHHWKLAAVNQLGNTV